MYAKPECTACGSKNLRHHVLDYWHTCNDCGHRFNAPCSPHKHGLGAMVRAAKRTKRS